MKVIPVPCQNPILKDGNSKFCQDIDLQIHIKAGIAITMYDAPNIHNNAKGISIAAIPAL